MGCFGRIFDLLKKIFFLSVETYLSIGGMFLDLPHFCPHIAYWAGFLDKTKERGLLFIPLEHLLFPDALCKGSFWFQFCPHGKPLRWVFLLFTEEEVTIKRPGTSPVPQSCREEGQGLVPCSPQYSKAYPVSATSCALDPGELLHPQRPRKP